MLANAMNITSLKSLVPTLMTKAQSIGVPLATAVGGIAAALGLSKIAQDNADEVGRLASQISGSHEPSNATNHVGDVGAKVVNGTPNLSEEKSLVSRLFTKSKDLDWSFISTTLGAATFIALLYVVLSRSDIVKSIGDLLSGLLSMLGLEGLAAKVDSWGEDESANQSNVDVVNSNSVSTNADFEMLETDLKILGTVFGHRDDQNISMLRRLFMMDAEELASYVKLKRSIAAAER